MNHPHPLRGYLQNEGITLYRWCLNHGFHRCTIDHYLFMRACPPAARAKILALATGGAVPPEAWIWPGDHPWPCEIATT